MNFLFGLVPETPYVILPLTPTFKSLLYKEMKGPRPVCGSAPVLADDIGVPKDICPLVPICTLDPEGYVVP